jgi:hypothetical protein
MTIQFPAPYKARPIRFLELWEHEGWRVKVYGIAAAAERPSQELVEAIKKEPKLKEMALVKYSRLSVQPVTKAQFEATVALNMTWVKHQGPVGAEVSFDPRTERIEPDSDGRGVTQATFDTPGQYVLRVRLDNFPASDSSFADQCCWTNGYVPVTVTP